MTHLRSHPVWVRGLKHRYGGDGMGFRLSHPVWVRGLKLEEEILDPNKA